MSKHAALTVRGRASVVQRYQAGERVTHIARAMRISTHTVRKWVQRFQQFGSEGLKDRSSRPVRMPSKTPLATEQAVQELRLQRRCGRAIAKEIGLSIATVSRILRRAHMSRWCELQPRPQIVRYEHDAPGDLLHLDIKQLGRIGDKSRFQGDPSQRSRGIGHEYVHVAIDDRSRYALSWVADDQTQHTAVDLLEQAVARYAALGVPIRRVMTDNGSCYISLAFKAACARLGIIHKRTRPYTPRTNGKAERFIQTLLREWAYASTYSSSAARTDELPRWIHHYNWHRPHGGIGHLAPCSRLPQNGNNLLILHT